MLYVARRKERSPLGPGKGTEPILVRRNVNNCRQKGSNTSIWGGQNRKQKEPGGGSNTLVTVRKRSETTDVEIKHPSPTHSTL